MFYAILGPNLQNLHLVALCHHTLQLLRISSTYVFEKNAKVMSSYDGHLVHMYEQSYV